MINLTFVPNSKVLLQLSGGKDSTACLLLLNEQNVKVEAIHFIHEYSYKMTTELSKQMCKDLNIPLHVVDITFQLENTLLNNFSDRPCRYCKAIMDEITINYAKSHNFSFICIGDTKDDIMLINRIKKKEGKLSLISRYLNKNVSIPENIHIFRPLLFTDSETILQYVLKKIPYFKRINDTGDKYFEYSREGCPLQFKDLGALYTKDLMKKLYEYNTCCAEFATMKGIRACIQLPSENIVTIPVGYESECQSFLLNKGFKVFPETNTLYRFLYSINIALIKTMRSEDVINMALLRFCERIELPLSQGQNLINGIIIEQTDFAMATTWYKKMNILTLSLMSQKCYEELLYNICLEIFHTKDIKILINKK